MAEEPHIEEETVEDETPETVDEEQPEDEAKAFDGDYDPSRARKLIDKLRGENAELKKQKDAPAEDPEAGKLRTENLQLRVALELGIPEKLASRLQGSTREELLEDAAELIDIVTPRKEEPKSQQPRPRLKGGAKPEEEPELTGKDIAAKIRL